MMRTFSSLLALTLAVGTALGATTSPLAAETRAASGGAFAPVILVNGFGISGYEIEQRARFMQLLGAKGDLRQQAEEALIEDRLRMWKANALGLTLKKEQIAQGMAEFASRANLSTEDFLKALSEAGVDAPTYRDFVSAGVIWREVVRANYAGRVQISDADVARANALETARPELAQVLLSEVVVRVFPGRDTEAMAAARKAASARSEADFATVAKEISSSKTSAKGGRLDWMPLAALPPEVRMAVMNLRPGQSTGPIMTPNSISVFFLRGIDEGGKVAPGAQAVSYATLVLGPSGAPETAALAQKAAARAKTCDDLYTVAKGLPQERLTRVEAARAGTVPADIGKVLARLDVDESKVLNRGGADVLVMLCDRGRALNATVGETGPSRDAMKNQLSNARLGSLSEKLMAELKAQAVIVRP